MPGNLLAVKQDDRNIVAIPGFQFGVGGDVDDFEFNPATLDDFLRPVAQMAARLGVDRNFHPESNSGLIAVVLGLVWAIYRDAEVIGLFLCELGELHADFVEV